MDTDLRVLVCDFHRNVVEEIRCVGQKEKEIVKVGMKQLAPLPPVADREFHFHMMRV